MVFYRHDQWGVACLADDTRFLTVVFFFGGDHCLGTSAIGTIINKGGPTFNLNAQSHYNVVHDVSGIVCGTLDLNEVYCI